MGNKVKCTLCGAKIFQEIFNQGNSKILKCLSCGLTFRYPLPAKSEIQKLYNQEKLLKTRYFQGLKKNYDQKNPVVSIYKEELGKLNKITKPSRILDVGCAYGVFLDLARIYGWEPYGVEISKTSASYAKKAFKLPIFAGTLEEAKYPSNFFKVITMWDLVEHLSEPLATLKETRRILEKNGILLILTIDTDSLIGKIANSTTKTKDFLYDPQHTYFFSSRTLAKMLQKAGFKKIETLDKFGAQIKRWQSREIPLVLEIGTNLLDVIAKIAGMEYRQVIIARK
ncbi:hypothetical protein A2V71_03240 [Candidatus Berkelbacteria bacterium RBG_13_40_8]|uniref:Methyltransferase type 11 domain-containing protein n=1 Tax=Candidatus Berkelbacteria bacterium RBG_13_40_8 TaxID=1797467 RepID=A0A1F5DPK5_9BACT|nr:MAG: hypothetical protein A2V71_03240 [Candidatus Berkelbacteria bacterium RBG_13_40_8]